MWIFELIGELLGDFFHRVMLAVFTGPIFSFAFIFWMFAIFLWIVLGFIGRGMTKFYKTETRGRVWTAYDEVFVGIPSIILGPIGIIMDAAMIHWICRRAGLETRFGFKE
ncbi:MAG: hypothetical protein HYV47_00270 [Candidatus Nealsonbacteria bacterium]|nr:hypothetical protein [Candidatus Nealsonbacteria bacterium]